MALVNIKISKLCFDSPHPSLSRYKHHIQYKQVNVKCCGSLTIEETDSRDEDTDLQVYKAASLKLRRQPHFKRQPLYLRKEVTYKIGVLLIEE